MALQREQIDTLLAEIDGVLSKANPRLPWVMSSEVTQQRQTLERIRHYLKGLQSESALSSVDSSGYRPWSEPVPTTNLEVSAGQFSSGQLSSGQWVESPNSPQAALMLSQQMMQAFTQDLTQLRSSLLQPLHSETVRLQQQRDSLLQEIRQLERQRQQHTLIQQRASQEQQVYDFLQGLMDRLQERLSQQINQVVGTLAAQAKMGDSSLVLESQGGSALFPQEAGLPPLPPAQRVEQLQMLQARADQVMMTLDTTLRAFAEALQQNIQSYESSLSQGLDKMHSMGQQGEAIVANLVQKLADQVSGQVLSGTLPSLPASPGSRLQGFNVQNANLQAAGPQPTQTLSQTVAQTAAGLSAGQHFSTYASPESGDRGTPRFGVPLSKSSKPSGLSSSSASGKTVSKPIADSIGTPSPTSQSASENTTDLDLDFDLLEQLEQTTMDSPTGDLQTGDSQAGETQVGNEELDAFYASLFGDTPRKVEPLDLKLEAELELEIELEPEIELEIAPEPKSDIEADLEADLELELGLQLGPETEEPSEMAGFKGESLGQEALNDDPFADLGTGLADDEEALDLDLLDDVEPEAPAPEVQTSGVAGVASSGATSERIQNIPFVQNAGAMDPLAALSLELQVPFQGVTELSPQRPGLTAESSLSEDSITDPLMADLEEALQSLGSPTVTPEVTTTLTGSPASGLSNDTRPLTSSREEEAIPPEDVIKTLADVLPAVTEDARFNDSGKFPQRANVSLIPTPPPQTVPDKPPEVDLEDEIYHLAHPEEPLLVSDDGEEGSQIELHLEPETLQQLTEDLSNLERQPPVDTEDLFNLDRLDEADGFGENRGVQTQGMGEEFEEEFGEVRTSVKSETSPQDLFTEDLFGDGFAAPQGQDQELPEETSGLLEDLLEESSPAESLLPEAEENGLDWLLEEPSPRPAMLPAPSATSQASFDLFANSAFERNLEEDLDLDSSFEEASELSLDRMTDWFGDEAPQSASSEDSFLIDHLFADLPDAEKKNDDWNAWEP